MVRKASLRSCMLRFVAAAAATACRGAHAARVLQDSLLDTGALQIQFARTALSGSAGAAQPGQLSEGPPGPFLSSLSTTAPAQLRPLTLAFADQIDTRDAVTVDYIINQLCPAANSILARSVRVRSRRTDWRGTPGGVGWGASPEEGRVGVSLRAGRLYAMYTFRDQSGLIRQCITPYSSPDTRLFVASARCWSSRGLLDSAQLCKLTANLGLVLQKLPPLSPRIQCCIFESVLPL